MVLQTALQNENSNHDNDLDKFSKHERQLRQRLFKKLRCFKLTHLALIIAKEAYEVGFTAKSQQKLSMLSGYSIKTVALYLKELEARHVVRCARMRSFERGWNSVKLIVMNWNSVDYHPPRGYSIDSLRQLKHICLIDCTDKRWIDFMFKAHNKARARYLSGDNFKSTKPTNRLKNDQVFRTWSNTIKPPEEINELPTKIRKEKKIDNQSFALAMLIDNLAIEFLSRLDFWGFDRKSYLSNDENRRIIHRAYCQTLWDMHRTTPHDAFLNTCLYALSNQSLFPKYSTAMRLRHNFSTIGAMQKSGLKLIVQNTHIDRLEQYKACYETNNEK